MFFPGALFAFSSSCFQWCEEIAYPEGMDQQSPGQSDYNVSSKVRVPPSGVAASQVVAHAAAPNAGINAHHVQQTCGSTTMGAVPAINPDANHILQMQLQAAGMVQFQQGQAQRCMNNNPLMSPPSGGGNMNQLNMLINSSMQQNNLWWEAFRAGAMWAQSQSGQLQMPFFIQQAQGGGGSNQPPAGWGQYGGAGGGTGGGNAHGSLQGSFNPNLHRM